MNVSKLIRQSDLKKPLRVIFLFIIFFLGIFLGCFFWNKIILPFQNPWEVVGHLAELKYNPINNIFRFIVFLLCPITILYAIYMIKIKKLNNYLFHFTEGVKNSNYQIPFMLSKSNQKILTIILIIFSIVVAINIVTDRSAGNFDSFHEGESLGTSVSYIAGKIPYKDFIFVHGIYNDPLRSVAAFRLFGKSIGSARTLESIIKILTFIFLTLFLIILFRWNFLYAFSSLLILTFLHGGGIISNCYIPEIICILPRDITTFFFLAVFLTLLSLVSTNRHIRNIKIFLIVSFLFSFIPAASFWYSIDRGFYIFATYLIIAPILYYYYFHKTNILRSLYLISSFFGLLSAILLGMVFLRGYFLDFFKFVFLIMPKYKELMDGRMYPIFSSKIGFFICVLIAANFYWIAYKFLQELQINGRNIIFSMNIFIEKYLVEFSLLLLSIFFFRSALGRSDVPHIIYSSSIIYILSIYIIFKHYIDKFFAMYQRNNDLIRFKLNKVLTFSLIAVIFFFSIVGVRRIYYEHLFIKNFPVKVKDLSFIPDNYKATISFLRENLKDEEKFITMTSEASWYYFLDQACPVRFPVVWFAAPNFYQKEFIEQLKNTNVKFILYKNNHWANSIDGYNNEIRLPIIIKYIKQYYKFFQKIDDNEIWIKKSLV